MPMSLCLAQGVFVFKCRHTYEGDICKITTYSNKKQHLLGLKCSIVQDAIRKGTQHLFVGIWTTFLHPSQKVLNLSHHQ